MSIVLTIVMCSSMANQCVEPHTFDKVYDDFYTCMVDGYKKSMDKTIEMGREEINQYGIYLKFDCQQILLPPKKPKIKA